LSVSVYLLPRPSFLTLPLLCFSSLPSPSLSLSFHSLLPRLSLSFPFQLVSPGGGFPGEAWCQAEKGLRCLAGPPLLDHYSRCCCVFIGPYLLATAQAILWSCGTVVGAGVVHCLSGLGLYTHRPMGHKYGVMKQTDRVILYYE
jgi:hypothetical protein